jgi:hypothetical protein
MSGRFAPEHTRRPYRLRGSTSSRHLLKTCAAAYSPSGYTPWPPDDFNPTPPPLTALANSDLRAGYAAGPWPLARAASARALSQAHLRLFEEEIPTVLVLSTMSAQTMQYRGADLIIASLRHESRGHGSPHDAIWQLLIDETDAAMAQHLLRAS